MKHWKSDLKSQISKVRFFCLLCSVFCLLFTGCITTEYNVGSHTQDTFFYSSEREAAMGRNIHRKIAKEFTLSKNPYDLQRLDAIAKKIAAVADRKEFGYNFYIIEKDSEEKEEVNAFSLPGGYVYIFKKLFDLLNDDELAFVVAHEVGHIVSRHHIKRLQAAMGYNLVLIASAAVASDPGFSQGVSLALAQLLAAYSREDEFNADELAAKYSQAAGFDSSAGISLLEKLYAQEKKKITPLSYFRTHPYHAQRIRHIKETLRLPLSVDDYIN